jgi:hypothetical protein
MSKGPASFGIGVGEALGAGVRGVVSAPLPLFAAGAMTLGVYLAFRLMSQSAADTGDLVQSLALDLLGLVVGGIVSLVWFSYALDADRGVQVDLRRPFLRPMAFWDQGVASFWFWAAVLFGLRYLYGIPSLIAVVFYAFYGFVIADGAATSGMRALGTSVRLGEGRRIGLFAFAVLLLVINLFGAIAVGYGVTPLTAALAFLGILITTNVSLVTGARIYRKLNGETT